MKSTIFLSFFVGLAGVAAAQPQLNNWFFSYNGINFSSGSPINIPGGKIDRMEGASTISDKNGQLLFSAVAGVAQKHHASVRFCE